MSATRPRALWRRIVSLGLSVALLFGTFSTCEAILVKPATTAGVSKAAALPASNEKSINCNGDVPYYTATQQSNTLAFLEALREALPPLQSRWQCKNFCAWDGVYCSDKGVEVSLQSSTLRGSLPEVPPNVDIDELVLTSLELSGKSQTLVGAMPWSWMLIPSLTSLKIPGVGLSGGPPSILPPNGRTASVLSVGRALGKEISPLGIQGVRRTATGLKVLDISNNSIGGSLPAIFSNYFPNAYAFYLQNNRFTGTLPETWSSMAHLGILHLHNNHLTGSIPAAWSAMPNISDIRLQQNNLCGCVPESLQALETDTTRFAKLHLTADIPQRSPECATTYACEHTSGSSVVPPPSSSVPSDSSEVPNPVVPSSSSDVPTPVEPSSDSVSDRFVEVLSALCPNVGAFDTETLISNKESICCLSWDGSGYLSSCGDSIGGYSNTTVTCSGSLGSRGSFSCCSKVFEDGSAQYVGLRCRDIVGDGAVAPSTLWLLRPNGGDVVIAVTLVAMLLII